MSNIALINQPYRRRHDAVTGELINDLPYLHVTRDNRRIRRGSEKLDFTVYGSIIVKRRVKSAKRKFDWI